MKPIRTFSHTFFGLAMATVFCPPAMAKSVRFLIVDPTTGKPVQGYVLVDEPSEHQYLTSQSNASGLTASLDPVKFSMASLAPARLPERGSVETVRVPIGGQVTIQQKRPVKDIVIQVRASRIRPNAPPAGSSGTERNRTEITKYVNTTQANTRDLTKGQAGVAEDSAGQQHVRGEHTDIAYVVDGVPLPDTLSGRVGSVVVPSTIESLDIITGGFAPEFGGQTAAVLNISTLPGVTKAERDLTLQGGSYNAMNGDLTAVGPLGPKANYTFDFSGTSTNNYIEPLQPNNQDAHNHGSSESGFAKFRFAPDNKDAFTLTLSGNPDQSQVPNRTGLPASFAQAGQGYGFEGLRNADGSIAPFAAINPGGLGSGTELLPSQQQEGQDIVQREINEFATLNYVRKLNARDTAQSAVTILHSGQSVTNDNPGVNELALPIDNSIEYNPDVTRNAHQVEGIENISLPRGHHKFKVGILYDAESGDESYYIQPASQLALDDLAFLDPALAPAGTANPNNLDVNGVPVYTAKSGVSPTLYVHRSAFYEAGYLQDTWDTGHFTTNYGVRYDHYTETQSGGQAGVNESLLSPRLNFSYRLDHLTELRASYNKLFDTPPLAQGALVGVAIVPETINQYDLGVTHLFAHGQSVSLAYYYKDISEQADVGLLIPGVENGIYSGVNFQKGAVHGTEFSYELSPPKGVGWDSYVNFSFSSAMPNGNDSTGAPAPDYNDHDQRKTLGTGLAYSWKGGATVSSTFNYGSGLTSSVIPPSTARHPRHEIGLHATTGDGVFKGHGGFSLDIANVFDNRQVINFQSGFSGTRFQQGRRVLVAANYKF